MDSDAIARLRGMSLEEAVRFYDVVWKSGWRAIAELGRNDRFFLLVYLLGRKDACRPWIYERCREVEAAPEGFVDIWAREHYKSTVITFAGIIQEILKDPEITIGIFSYNYKEAKKFLNQIKYEFEANENLQAAYPEILYKDPKRDARRWSEDGGIIVKRKGNPREATIEAHGLVDNMPTGMHYGLRVYDDVVTDDTVRTPEMIEKVTDRWRMSINLGKEGGKAWYIGTFYHFNDTYRTMISEGVAEPRIYPCTKDGSENGEPILFGQEYLDMKRLAMGPYIYACHAKGTKVLMADWTERDISEVQVGDSVVGWTMEPGEKSRLVATKVVAARNRVTETICASFHGGPDVHCTPDHKWWTGRRGTDTHNVYAPLGFDYHELKALCQVYDPDDLQRDNSPDQIVTAAYLGGIFDGEGSLSAGCIHIAQCENTNPAVCQKIRESLMALGFDFNECRPKSKPHHIDFCLRGGRREIIRFLNICKPAKAPQIVRSLFEHGTRDFGRNRQVNLRAIKQMGQRRVWNIQTETGNYIANGYASKNCQMLCNPVADNKQGFKEQWLKYHEGISDAGGMNVYLVVDPANEKKKHSDYTAMWVVGLSSDQNYYVLDIVRDRLNLSERWDMMLYLHRKWRPLATGYEKYGKDSDIQHFEEKMRQINYRFHITPLGGSTKKEDRIRRLIPVFEQGRMYLPPVLWRDDYEGRKRDLVSAFVEQEYKGFPVANHDDMFDALARIRDPELPTSWPSGGMDDGEPPPRRRYEGKPKHNTTWMAV